MHTGLFPAVLANGFMSGGHANQPPFLLYTGARNHMTYIKFWSAVNTGSNIETVYAYAKNNNAEDARVIGIAQLNPGDSVRFIDKDEVIFLQPTGTLWGRSTSTGNVDYWICGAREFYQE